MYFLFEDMSWLKTVFGVFKSCFAIISCLFVILNNF